MMGAAQRLVPARGGQALASAQARLICGCDNCSQTCSCLRCEAFQPGFRWDPGILQTVNIRRSRRCSEPDVNVSLPAGMSLMTQVGLVLKTIAKDFNVAALVRITAPRAAAPLLGALRCDAGKLERADYPLFHRKRRRPLQVTNHVTRGGGGGGGEVQPGLGMSWSHVPRTRILLERAKGPASCSGLRAATLIKSSRQVPRSTPTPELSPLRSP